MSLNRRIALVVFLLATLIMVLFAIVIEYASDQIEHSVLDELILRESAQIQRRLENGEKDPLPMSTQLQSWLTETEDSDVLPKAFRSLPIGIHHDIATGDSTYHVLRQPDDEGFLTLAYEINLVEAKEEQLKLVLFGVVLVAPGLLILLSSFFTARMTTPISQLAARLQHLDPSKRNIRLSQDFSGQEVEAIAKAFDRYQERLDVLIEREQSFSAAASHELRTPLAIIGTSVELLGKREHQADIDSVQLRRIRQAVNQMAEVVNSLLALSRNRMPRLVSPLQIALILDEAMAHFRDQSADKPVELISECSPELVMWIPEGDFLIILGNLVQNAIRNTESGTITIRCSAEKLVVSDTGRGMPKEFARHIFDRQVQSHDSHGVGLGMHVVKRFCDRYGWPVEVESAVGEGTTVSVYWASVR